VDQILNKVGSPDHALLAEAGLDAPGMSSVERLAAIIARGARASAIFGEPIHQGASVVIPVAKAIWGVGGGKGPAGTGDGGGGGMHVAPVGYIHVEQGRARFHPLRKSMLSLGVMAALAGALMIAGRQLRLMRRDRRDEAKSSRK
jgi:uncharacterized spore protein YtfJ